MPHGTFAFALFAGGLRVSVAVFFSAVFRVAVALHWSWRPLQEELLSVSPNDLSSNS